MKITLSIRFLLLFLVAPLLFVAITPSPIFAQEPVLDFQAETVSDEYGIRLSWSANALVDHVEIERSDNGISAWESWGQSIGNQFVDTLVACSHTYFYRARTVGAAGVTGKWSDVVQGLVTPCAPIAVSVYPVPGWYILDVSWIDIAPEETGFRLERSPDGVAWSELAELPPNTRYYADRFGTAECSMQFYYRLRTERDRIERDEVFSPYTTAASNAVSPCSPTALWAELAHNGEHVRIHWRDNAPDETGFEVWRRSDANPISQFVATVPAAEAVGATVAWEDESPDCQAWNYYQIRAIRGTNSASPWEPRSPNALSIYVPNCPEPTSTPVGELFVHPQTTVSRPSPIDDSPAPATPPVSLK